MTIPVAVPPIASTTTAYCVSFTRPSTSRGSMRSDCFGVIGMSCDAASAPSAKRYHESLRLVAVMLCRTSGVDQPSAPPRRRVTFGRNRRVAGCMRAEYPAAVVSPITLTTAAILPPVPPLATNEYSPFARQPAEAAAPQSGCVVLPLRKRGSNTHAAPAETDGPLNAVVPLPPRGVNVIDGVTVAAPVFCTTIVDRPCPTPDTFFTAYGP